MPKSTLLAGSLAVTALVLAASDAQATNYSLWVHGRNTSQSSEQGNYDNFNQWGSASVSAGVNKKAVNWDGVSHISDSNYRIRDALDCFCTGSNWCYLVGYSAGDPQIGYALANYGGSSRNVKNAVAGSDGQCGDAGGTQTGWNVKWVDTGGAAGGGSELADLGYWAVSDPLTDDLRTGTMRGLYNHNATGGAWVYMFAGAKGTAYSGVLPGQDDEAVPYHSSGGMSSTGSFCNPGDWFCDGTLNTGTESSDGVAKWSYRSVSLRDDGESYNHYVNGNWEGIIGPVRADMATYAY